MLAVLAALLLVFAGFYAGWSAGRRMPATIAVQGVSGVESTTTDADFGIFWEAWRTIDEKHLSAADVSADARVNGAVSGLVRSLGDPYSQFFTPAAAKSFEEDVDGNFSGIGAEIGIRRDQLVIVAPLKGTPAERAGLKPNDQIFMIDATSTDNMAVDQAVSFIRGVLGTTVKLSIFRDGWERPKDFSIVRENIQAPTLDFKMLPDRIAYVQLYSFNANAETLFWNAMRKAADAGTEGLVLDLRGNPGGYLEVAVNLAGWFLPRGTVVVKEVGREGVLDTLRASGNEALAKIPVAVLIDEGSASAAEILAGTLRDNRQVKLIGQTSFGKGTVQEFMDLSGGSVIKLTIAHWVLPSGTILEDSGLKPDHEIEISEEDLKNERDPQLDKAIQVVKEEIANEN